MDKCVFTGLRAEQLKIKGDISSYMIDVGGKKHIIRVPYNAENHFPNDPFFRENRYLFEALLINDNWIADEKSVDLSLDVLRTILENKGFPKKPQEKYDMLFSSLFSFQKEDGEWVLMDDVDQDKLLWKKIYFKSRNELEFYTQSLIEHGLIEVIRKDLTKDEAAEVVKYRITLVGLKYYFDLQASGSNSRNCFIAMAFRDETKDTREAIRAALEETGFYPIFIDELDLDSDKTINDEIIVNLRKCKFCIADFSYHSNGVYFESGFALGQGKQVIYTCSASEFEKAHFDIRPLQHIIYRDVNQLKIELIAKIEAWIK